MGEKYDNKDKIYDIKDIRREYNKYVLSTISSKSSNWYKIVRYVKNICNKSNLYYREDDKNIILDKISFDYVINIFKIRKLYFDSKINLYSTSEVAELTKFNSSTISEATIKGEMSFATIIGGQYYFYKNDIDKLLEELNKTYTVSEVTKIVNEKSIFSNIGSFIVRNYIKESFETVYLPIDKKNLRMYKKDIGDLILKINNNYKVKRKNIGISEYLLKFKDKCDLNVITNIDLNSFVNYKELKSICKKNLNTNGNEKYIKHIISVCTSKNIKLYTNNNYEDIYIHRSELNIYKNYYNEKIDKDDLNEYYTNKEVQGMFNIKDTSRIAKYCGLKKIGNKKYINKEKVNQLLNIKESTIPIRDISIELQIDIKKVVRTIEKLGINRIEKNKHPLGNVILITKEDFEKVKEYIFYKNELKKADNLYTKYKIEIGANDFNESNNTTLKIFDEFAYERLKDNSGDYIYNALIKLRRNILQNLNIDMFNIGDSRIISIIKLINEGIVKNEFIYFINYCKDNYKTKYKKDYMIKSINKGEEKKPYHIEQWVNFIRLIFDKNSHKYQEYLSKAISNRVHAMTWLYCAFNCICSWRATQIMKDIPFPNLELELNLDEYKALNIIKSGQFDENMAQIIVNNLIKKVNTFDIKVRKTSKSNNNQKLRLTITKPYVYVIGMLIVLCEIHRRESIKSNRRLVVDALITEKATRKENHLEFFGQEYIDIFGDRYFNNISATKTYSNIINLISQNNGWGIGYYIASIERAHIQKNGIATTTQIYLDYINKDNDIDKIMYSLWERGTFGFLPYQMMKMLYGDDFVKKDILLQNEKINMLLPSKNTEIEKIVKSSSYHSKKAKDVLLKLKKQIINEKKDVREVIKNILIKIAKGEAPSKIEYVQCIIKSIDKNLCIYPKRSSCGGCEYAIHEMYFLIELNNIINETIEIISKSEDDFDCKRYSHILMEVYLPILDEAIGVLGEARVNTFINLNEFNNKIKKIVLDNKLLLEEHYK